jgi:hypothetical protein
MSRLRRLALAIANLLRGRATREELRTIERSDIARAQPRAKDIEASPMLDNAGGCKYYAHSAHPSMGLLVSNPGSNQCAMIWEAHAPCVMETHGQAPDLARCPLRAEHNFTTRDTAMQTYRPIQGWFTIT